MPTPGTSRPPTSADPADFSPPLLRIRETPPAPLAGWAFRLLTALIACALLWAVFGRLDIVAVADGKLVPASYLKIVQPPEQGIVREILVKEGDTVSEGQTLIRMDAVYAQADLKTLGYEYHGKQLGLRRITAQLDGGKLLRQRGDPEDLYARVAAQYDANVQAYENALAQERSVLDKAGHDFAAAQQTKAKLEQVLPHYVAQENAFEKLAKDGYAGRILATDKQRERIEKEQDLRTQEYIIQSSLALMEQSRKKIAQITSDYRRQLQNERVETAAAFERVEQEMKKNQHRNRLLELRAPAAGTVKDLATHTVGTVASPGMILMTLVPQNERMIAEVWVGNADIGFVRPEQPVKLKLAAFQFQKYGMVQGKVKQVSADATEAAGPNARSDALGGRDRPTGPLAYRTVVELDSQRLTSDDRYYPMSPGMQVSAEIHLGTRSVLEYLLSPVQKAFHEAGRER